MKKTIQVLVILFGAAAAMAQNGISYRFEKGKTYRYMADSDVKMVMDMAGQNMVSDIKAHLVISIKPTEISSNGDLTCEASYDTILTKVNMMRMDTTMYVTDLMGKRAKIVFSKYGRTKTVAAIDSFPKNSMILRMMNGDPMIYMRRLLVDMPNQAFTAGSTWINTTPDSVKNTNMEMVITPNVEYKWVGRESKSGRDCIKMQLTGPMTMAGKGNQMGADFFIEGEGKTSGFVYFDDKAGVLVSAESTSEQQMNIAVSGGANMTITQSQNVSSKTVLLP
jgi:hypothetical protein